ncbi:virulence [Clostridium sp. OM05-9]|uniref:virulence n=1 Tax=Clostridium sp. OM05-9 TaxID=2293045 RepID=UPI000E4F781D|nr:virulence [Clostridium sp. OM05-9]RHV09826.1 virulence [Clostridium sp. OM05-9]
MVLHFNVKGESRKAMVTAIEKEIGGKARYLGAPSCAYEIGNYTVGRNGELEFGDFDDIDEVAPIVDACVMATGITPAEWEENKDAEEAETEGAMELTVTIPFTKVNVANLTSLLEAKGSLIKDALGITDLRFEMNEDSVSFPWFSKVEPEEAMTYTKFITAICEMTMKQKRITAKPKENENEKYAFRCFLLRLGFIGDEYKADRKLLLSKLNGSSAFKCGAKKGGEQ